MDEVLLALVGVLLATTCGAAVEYYRQLRRAQREYEKAREVVEDVVMSFNRQLKQESGKVEYLAYKTEALSSRSESVLKKAEEVDKKISGLESKVNVVFEDREKAVSSLEEMNKKICDVATTQEALSAKISGIEEQARQFSIVPETKIEAVIPIKREKALAPLTETELSVLELLACEGKCDFCKP